MQYPGRVHRSGLISDLLEGRISDKSSYLCGRVIGLIDGESPSFDFGSELVGENGFVLQDSSGKIVVLADQMPKVGAIVEVRVVELEKGMVRLLAGHIKVLADCEDFYISFKESPNYKKIVIDERLRSNLIKRSMIMSAIRDFFFTHGFIEMETPCLVKLPGMEPYLDVFKTKLVADFAADQKIDQEMYLITSPEYAMKKLLVGGMEKVFQLTKSFRNKETFSQIHNPEFSILEWYRAFASYEEIMDDTEELVKFLWNRFGQKDSSGKLKKLSYGDSEIDILSNWKRMTVLEAFKKFAEVDQKTFFNLDSLRKVVKMKGYPISTQANFDDCFFTIFLNEIEPKLGFDKPVILYEYPVSMAALSKRCEGDERFAERFEVYIAGVELCNAFTELNDPSEQEKRLKLESEERRQLGKDDYAVDQSFIEALKFGMPPAGGNALGVDRLMMLLLGEIDIKNVLNFPYQDL